MRRALTLVVLVASALVAPACGSDDGTDPGSEGDVTGAEIVLEIEDGQADCANMLQKRSALIAEHAVFAKDDEFGAQAAALSTRVREIRRICCST